VNSSVSFQVTGGSEMKGIQGKYFVLRMNIINALKLRPLQALELYDMFAKRAGVDNIEKFDDVGLTPLERSGFIKTRMNMKIYYQGGYPTFYYLTEKGKKVK
jgi:hypothetical protein